MTLFTNMPDALRLALLALLCFWFGTISEGRFRGRSIIVDDNHKYSPSLPPMIMAAAFVAYFILDMVSWHSVNGIIQFGLFVLKSAIWIAVFSAAVCLLIEPLRKRFNASACSMLWIALNYMYFHVLMNVSYGVVKPVLRLNIAPAVFKWAMPVYLLIAAAVFARGLIKHLIFRAQLMAKARPAEDTELNERLDQIATDLSGRKLHIDLLISPEISSPLSVGIFKKTTYVILPDVSYDYDEIDMIFRHEVIHILRSDPEAKLFMLFCCSLLWWDPLMWKGSEFCSQDIELSCDEAVLYGADDEEKKRYAGLVIESASCDRGFTTCLSARAETLRYRLRRIMEPPVDRSGVALIAILMFLLVVSSNLISFEVPMGTVAQTKVMQQAGSSELSVTSLSLSEGSRFIYGDELSDEVSSRLISLVSEIEISVAEVQMKRSAERIYLTLGYEGGWMRIVIYDDMIYVAGGPLYSSEHLLNHPYIITNPEKVQEIRSLLGSN